MFDRRRVCVALGAAGAALMTGHAYAQAELPKVVLSKDPNCGCCGGWAEHMKRAGFAVEVVTTSQLDEVKARLGVPDDLSSCHTAEVSGYVIEGHVPPDAVRRLLAEKPKALGLAVPGMPAGSPGMEMAGAAPEDYEVVLFGASGRSTFARYRGTKLV